MCLPTECSNSALLTISDSIAINFLNDETILRGVGNELHLLNRCKTDTKVLVRLRDKIHGIKVDSNSRSLLVFGEKEFVFLEWKEDQNFLEHYRARLTDWISSAKFHEDDVGFVIVTAHSVLLEFKYSFKADDMGKCLISQRVSCVDKSTLYCAHLYGKNWQDLVVFGGNAFGELLIWQPKGKTIENGKEFVPLLHRITAHNGVIFSIDFCPKENLLTTTSDDRSISFWRVHNQNDWAKADIKAIASGYGHQARVFQGRIIHCDNIAYAITTSEDSHLCLWTPNGELVYKNRFQFGAVIWNLAYNENTASIYTVGSTGNIVAHNLRKILEENQRKTPKKLTSCNPLDDSEYIAKIKFLRNNVLIGLTNHNRLLTYDCRFSCWQKVNGFDGYKCTVLEVHGDIVALCGYKRLTLLELNDVQLKLLYDKEILKGVIRSFHFLSGTKYLIADELGNCILLNRENLQVQHTIELPKCKERWLTSALLVNREFLLVSNRLGNVMLYEDQEKLNNFQLKYILKHPHGYLGATLMKLIELSDDCAYVQSAGHDGTLKVFCLNFKEARLRIKSHQVVPLAWIESSVILNDIEVLLGFNDNYFTAWTEEYDTVSKVSCGGGHRCWHYFIDSVDSDSKAYFIKLVFIKNKNVLFYELPLLNQLQEDIDLPYRNRWHTRACNVLDILSQNNSQQLIAISAGDDNLIKISTIEFRSARFHQKAQIHSHISNIRALKVFQKPFENNCLIFSVGGRAQLCASSIDLKDFSITEQLNYTLKPSNEHSPTKAKSHSFDPETRIMSIDVINDTNSAYIINLACSDGFLRKLYMDTDFNVHLDKEFYYGKCLLQVRSLLDSYVIVAATDGVVTFFDLNLTTRYLELPLHSSGINALDLNYENDEKILHLLTGGDDQAVVYTQISFEDLQKPKIMEKLHLPQLHTAQVTAARFSKCGRYSFTSGVDQNLIQYDLETMEIVRVIHSCVADVKGLVLANDADACILYGCGLQIFEKCS